ncbi:hypothetical protein D9M72_447010 [compost metagenome]
MNTASGLCSSTYAALALLKALHSASRSADSAPKRQLPLRSVTTSQPCSLAIGPSAAMYCCACESPSTTIRLVTTSGLLFCRQPESSGSLGTLPSVQRPSISAHSFFMAAGAGMILASGVGFPAFSGVSAAAPGVSSLGCAAAAASSAVSLVCHSDTGPASRAPHATITTAFRQIRRCGQCHSRSGFSTNRVVRTAIATEAATMARPWTRFGETTPVPARARTSSGQCHKYSA